MAEEVNSNGSNYGIPTGSGLVINAINETKWQSVGRISPVAGNAGGLVTSGLIGTVDVVGAATQGTVSDVFVQAVGLVANLSGGLIGAGIGGGAGGFVGGPIGMVGGGVAGATAGSAAAEAGAEAAAKSLVRALDANVVRGGTFTDLNSDGSIRTQRISPLAVNEGGVRSDGLHIMVTINRPDGTVQRYVDRIGVYDDRFCRKVRTCALTRWPDRRLRRKARVDRKRAANPKLSLPDHVCRFDPVQSCRR